MQPNEQHDAVQPSDATERSLARLLKLSGERGMPAPRAAEQAKAAALEVWESTLRAQRFRHRRKLILAWVAAVSTVTIGALAWLSASVRDSSVPSTARARVAMVWGDATLVDPTGQTLPLTAGAAEMPSGTQMLTGEGRVALGLGDSLSLRVDLNSRLRFDGEQRITLLSGAIYVDSGGLSTGSDLRIITPAGEVRHQGTQYLIAVLPSTTRILVREGRVQLSGHQQRIHVAAGEGIDMDQAGSISRRSAPSFGGSWDWVSTIVPAIDLDNRPLREFLAWMAREHGWQLRYASPSAERAVQSIRLHGSAQGKTPLDTLHRVSLITGLAMSADNGVLIVGDRHE